MSLFIANFPSQTPDQEIKNMFLPYGRIHFSRQKTYGFVQLQSVELAEKALSNLQGRLIRGCPARLEWNYKEPGSTQRIPFNTMEVEEENKETNDTELSQMLEEDEITEWMDYINLALSFFEKLTSLHNLTDLVTRTNISTTEKFIQFTSQNKMLTFEDFGEELEDIVGKHELNRYMELDRIVNKLLFLVDKYPSQDYLMSRNPKSAIDIIQIIFRNMMTWTRQALCITVANKCGMLWNTFCELYGTDEDALTYFNYVTIGRALSSGFRQNIIQELNRAIRTLDADIAAFMYTILKLTFNYQDEVGQWWSVLRDKKWEIVHMQAAEADLKSEIINDAFYLSHRLLSCKDHRILKFYEALGLDLQNEVQDSDQVLKDLKDLWPKRFIICPLRREKYTDWAITMMNGGLLLESELLLNYLNKDRNVVRTMFVILHELAHEKERNQLLKNNYLFETPYLKTHSFRTLFRPEQIGDALAYEILSFDQSEEKWNRLLSALDDLTRKTSKRKRVIGRTNTTIYRGCGTQSIIDCEKESGEIWKRCSRF